MGINYNESDRVMEVEAEHTKWWNMVDEYLSDDEGAQNILKAHQVTLIVVRFESILALHRSILATSKKDSAYNVALQRCVFASRSIVNTLHRAIKGFGAFDGSPGQHGYERTALVWPSFTWAIWMSVFTIVFAATENQVAKDTAMKLADRSLEVLEHLARRGTNWPEACSVAINNLTSKLREASSRGSTARPGIFPDIAGSRANSATTRMDESGRQNSFRLQSHHQIRSADQQNNHVRTARTPVIPALSNDPVLSLNSRGQTRGLITDFSHPFVPDVNAINAINPAANYLAGAGNFLGIAQQSSDNPLPNDEIMHLFNGEDMAHWFGGETNLGNMMPFDRGLPFGHEC